MLVLKYSFVCSSQIVCEKKNILASGCAVVRAFPLYSRKTCRVGEGTNDSSFNVEFLVFQDDKLMCPPDLTTPELVKVTETLSDLAYGIQLTARIVDTPCCDMNTEDFVNVRIY